ncbi:MAG: alpha-glucuronidase [Anaerophaga sp.]|nr:alpha-glucuronidase [Anaerophaga sp.]
MRFKKILLILPMLIIPLIAFSETGERLWLRYCPLPDDVQSRYAGLFSVYFEPGSPTVNVAKNELSKAFKGMMGEGLQFQDNIRKSSLLIGKGISRKAEIEGLEEALKKCGSEGYVIKSAEIDGRKKIIVSANSDAGILYGTFAFIRMMQTGRSPEDLNIIEKPEYDMRLLNHWDNLDGTVERGYAGHSIWWNRQKDFDDLKEHYLTYARANASVGINGTVLNNVNADPQVLTHDYIEKFARFADLLRPYNIKVYMSVNFSSPAIIGGLEDSDPLREEVRQWWKQKVAEIYELIPDFGGFLVKANSEGQPGPQDYGRTHAEGANMMAEALEPYGGIVMWRAFVYSPSGDDRAKQAYNEFVPLDGKFHENVIIQVKNGPVDFQPREPFSPIFGAMKHTPLMIEFQITQEYLGFSDHLAYLAPLQKECLESDTYVKGPGSTVAKTTDGSIFNQAHSAIAGVANIGRDINWTGHHFAQANWYAYGRLAWDHTLAADNIAVEWVKMTFSHAPDFVQPVLNIMMRSREAVVNYMTPLGLHHLMGWGHHYGPEPWTDIENARPDWLPRYYHNASEYGIGFDRSESGSNAVEQYSEPLRSMFNNPGTCPENLILWFHHLPWDYRMSSGLTLWDELCYHYYHGVEEVRLMQKKWDRLTGMIDQERFDHVQHKLKIQTREAVWWRDACLLYFQTFSGMPIPHELERPAHDLEELMELEFDITHHN